jgi:hypothetical protein
VTARRPEHQNKHRQAANHAGQAGCKAQKGIKADVHRAAVPPAGSALLFKRENR